MIDVEKFADQLVTMNVTELQQLKKILKDKYGLEETIQTVVTTQEEVKPVIEEKSSFDVILTKVSEVTAEKLNAVKEVNKLLSVGLKAAMDMVKEGPVKLAEGVSKTSAETIRSTFTTLNAVVEIQ